MLRSDTSGTADRLRCLVFVGVVLSAVSLGRPAAGTVREVPERPYRRAEAETIRGLTNEIVSSPEFTPRKTFGQWLNEKLRKWDGPHLGLSSGVGRVVFSVFTIWCVLALLAILAHLGWTIWLGARPSGTQRGAVAGGGGPGREIASAEELWGRSEELAGSGAYREAMGVLLLALLRQLETRNVVSFHNSKTNGEYVAEYPGDVPGRRAFGEFVGAFERSIYGGLPVARKTYEGMTSAAERITHDVSEYKPI
ncbi:MAG: DUF4129 domain-containing protein [Planctomycetota bacterium]|jgi:hypothetical protein